jgi:hypothetical protein
MEALRDLRATRRLPPDEQAEVERLLPIVEQIVCDSFAFGTASAPRR